MTLLSGDLTTPNRVSTWMATGPTLPSAVLTQLIGSMTGLIYAKLNRSRIYSQTFTRVFDGVGTMQIVLPDYPVTAISSVQQGACIVPQSSLPVVSSSGALSQPSGTTECYGWRCPLWSGNLPGENAVLEFDNGFFWPRVQNVKITYTAGYLIANEAQTVPAATPYAITVLQQQGIWCRDNGVTYASTGVALTPVTANPTQGQYVVGPDSTPGLYTFSAADEGQELLISYSFIPAVLEEACIQMVAERYAYRTRVGELSKSLGGQETVSFMRGRGGPGFLGGLPPEVVSMISDYISVVPPVIGAPV